MGFPRIRRKPTTKTFAVIHWPVAFPPGDGLFPKVAENEAKLDLETSLTDTWKTMIELKKTGKVESNRPIL